MSFQDIMVAVHGIGKQRRFSTVRSVATRVANSHALAGNGKVRPVAQQPLGYFHSDVRSVTSVQLVDDAESLKDSDLRSVGFAEVFWADIPQEVVKEGRTLEETKAWARTVVARAHALCERAKQDPDRNYIVPPDFSLAGEVLDQVIETVYVLENLTFLAEKAGFFKFDLREVLEDYLGDVQLVTEFSYYRTDVIGRFHEAMASINQQYPNARLHIVAHSEGSVVGFLGLLHAMCRRNFVPADASKGRDAKIEPSEILPWLKQVRGFMTIGSPIDKHLLLWRRLWQDFDNAKDSLPAGQICWRNYYDYGDPVGFKLDSVRLWLAKKEIKSFEFCGCKQCRHDIGFARYLLPGAAHNEYWNDCEVFEHFIGSVVKNPFSVADLKNASSFVKKLAKHSDELSRYLFERFSIDAPNLLSSPDPSSQEIVDELNRIVRCLPLSLYESPTPDKVSPFAKVLSQEGKELLARKPSGPSLVALNRILLEQAYPDEIAKNGQQAAKQPRSKAVTAGLSAVLPFLCSFLLLTLGVYVLFKAVYAYVHPSLDPLQKFIRFEELGIRPADGLHGWSLLFAVVGLAGLVAGASLLARFRRLATGKSWILAGFAALLVGFGFYVGLVPDEIRREIGGRFWYLGGSWAPTLGILGVTAIAGMSGFLVMSSTLDNADRRQRWIMRGMRPLMICGAVAIGVVILSQLYPRTITRLWSNGTPIVSFSTEETALIKSAHLTSDELKQIIAANSTNWVSAVRKVEPVLATNSAIWPVVLAGGVFLYLWWLALLLFDLAFVWHRYIRNSKTNDRLREWNCHGFPRWDPRKPEECCNAGRSVPTQ